MMASSAKADSRVWKACLSCRRKKIKCDGADPCHMCHSRDQLCEYPNSNDNAAVSRRYAISFETRCQNMDDICQRMEAITQTLSKCIIASQKHSSTSPPTQDGQLPMPVNMSVTSTPQTTSYTDFLRPTSDYVTEQQSALHFQSKSVLLDHSDQSSPPPSYRSTSEPVGHMVSDSYGRLRYVGGAGNNIVIEAVQRLSPGGREPTSEQRSSIKRSEVELPFFMHNAKWPDLPHLPMAKDVARPPRYISDLLVGIYFDQLHYTFPILYKPRFMKQYQEMNNLKKDDQVDKGFLSVFFAVCACASGLLAQAPGSSALVGIEYYQKALLLYFASSGEVFLEQVQCLGLLALCSASWNVIAQSWRFAGQAVRIAQDLGLHVSSLREPLGSSHTIAEHVESQIFRCVWWSVFGMDCITSICLGRPMAADIAHCCCDLPMNISNEDLERGPGPNNQFSATSPSPMIGFLASTQLCKIAAEVHRFHSSYRLRCRNPNNSSFADVVPNVKILIRQLDNWLDELPDEIRFSANSQQTDPNLTMSVVVFILHSATIMNLYRPLVGLERMEGTDASPIINDPLSECTSAARSCIQAAELIHDCLPPSHYLAICVQYLTISGILMLNMARDDGVDQTTKAIDILSQIERIWPGASRNRSILERLLQSPRGGSDKDQQPTSFPLIEGAIWDQFPESDAFIEELLRGY